MSVAKLSKAEMKKRRIKDPVEDKILYAVVGTILGNIGVDTELCGIREG